MHALLYTSLQFQALHTHVQLVEVPASILTDGLLFFAFCSVMGDVRFHIGELNGFDFNTIHTLRTGPDGPLVGVAEYADIKMMVMTATHNSLSGEDNARALWDRVKTLKRLNGDELCKFCVIMHDGNKLLSYLLLSHQSASNPVRRAVQGLGKKAKISSSTKTGFTVHHLMPMSRLGDEQLTLKGVFSEALPEGVELPCHGSAPKATALLTSETDRSKQLTSMLLARKESDEEMREQRKEAGALHYSEGGMTATDPLDHPSYLKLFKAIHVEYQRNGPDLDVPEGLSYDEHLNLLRDARKVMQLVKFDLSQHKWTSGRQRKECVKLLRAHQAYCYPDGPDKKKTKKQKQLEEEEEEEEDDEAIEGSESSDTAEDDVVSDKRKQVVAAAAGKKKRKVIDSSDEEEDDAETGREVAGRTAAKGRRCYSRSRSPSRSRDRSRRCYSRSRSPSRSRDRSRRCYSRSRSPSRSRDRSSQL
jgi:hypothetical protein